MTSTKLTFLAVTILLLQASWCVLSQQGGTAAMMAFTSFEPGQDNGGGPAACDGNYHSNGDLLAALSTQWYAGGSRCHKQIRISWGDVFTVTAEVVDECDSQSGCKDNIIATSQAVWDALYMGENTDDEIAITWADA